LDSIDFVDHVKRSIEERKERIQETLMSGSLENMEMYKYLQGELNSLYYIEGEIKEYIKRQS
jgi:hypothetical protein|tara:strand:- start:264 stop:449 length:186 start_codon:yes stop_codon:yes gene_type:complete